MKQEKEPMSMEEYADKITDEVLKKNTSTFINAPIVNKDFLWNVVFDAIQLFQELQNEKHRNLKEEAEERRLEKERQEGK